MASAGMAPREKSKLREWVEIIAAALVLALVVRALVIQSYHIPSGSMEDTLLRGDVLFASKFYYGARIPFTNIRLPKVRDPRPGDVVIFEFPGDRKTDYIKRCVAIAGQTVETRDNRLFVDGARVEEPYAKYLYGEAPRAPFGPYVVPPGHIFVCGDNRDGSSDSRSWGPVSLDLVRGKALVIYFSIDYDRHRIRLSRIGDIVR